MSESESLEHDTLEDAPGSARGAQLPPEEEASEATLRRGERREEAGRGERPWCSADNEEIWTVLSGEPDDE